MKKTRKHNPLRTASRQDAIVMLMADHKKVKDLFSQFEKLEGQNDAEEEKAALAQQVCNELKVHAQLEEEIFYPAVREAIDDDDLMDEADVEHAGAKQLISELEAMRPGDDLYDAKVTVLGEQVDHHVKEEEDEMFPKVKKARLDTTRLGAEMHERKLELLAELGLPDESEEDTGASGGIRKKPAKSAQRHV